jgi:hypothetical protein
MNVPTVAPAQVIQVRAIQLSRSPLISRGALFDGLCFGLARRQFKVQSNFYGAQPRVSGEMRPCPISKCHYTRVTRMPQSWL